MVPLYRSAPWPAEASLAASPSSFILFWYASSKVASLQRS